MTQTLPLFGPGDGVSGDAFRAAPAGPLVRVRLTIAYDGHGFHGLAAQPGLRTVAGVLGEALERALRHRVTLSVAGRTDAGVHAWGQVVSFDTNEAGFDATNLQQTLNKLLGPSIAVRATSVAAPDFDARFSARSRRYRYTVLNRAVPDPFLAATAWHVPAALDLAALRLGCDALYGEQDFASFCRRPREGQGHPPASLVRRVLDAGWGEVDEGVLRFEIEASAFCHQMVRSIVGTLVDMGRGRRRAGEMAGIIRAADRAAAGQPAPPHGLCLWLVRY
ncbi:MAG: tRNA pseudouridine(38-40) synthase TruA [Acidimicrobiia bacterium]|nr:tRNA pseudouridine(38-40) synthase TruA [Acidimicrobiia bacterium]